jgi:hypothetical protein
MGGRGRSPPRCGSIGSRLDGYVDELDAGVVEVGERSLDLFGGVVVEQAVPAPSKQDSADDDGDGRVGLAELRLDQGSESFRPAVGWRFEDLQRHRRRPAGVRPLGRDGACVAGVGAHVNGSHPPVVYAGRALEGLVCPPVEFADGDEHRVVVCDGTGRRGGQRGLLLARDPFLAPGH